MSYPVEGYAPCSQYGTTDNQFATTYTPADQSQTQYGVPAYNPYTAPYQQNTAQYNPYNAPYTQGNSSYNQYGQSNTQDGGAYPHSSSYGQRPSSNTHDGQYSQVAPPYSSDGSTTTRRQSYNEVPPPTHNLQPPSFQNKPPRLSYNQAVPTSYNQAVASQRSEDSTATYNYAPPSSYNPITPLHNQPSPPVYNQAPPPSYNEAALPTHTEKPNTYEHQSYHQQRPTHPEGSAFPQSAAYPQQDPAYQQYPPSYTPNYQQGGDHHPQNTTYGPTYSPTIRPQRAPKRPHMPNKLQTHFKQPSKNTVARPPQSMTSMQPLQGGKSAVSSIHDVAFQNGYTVNWYEEAETGPAHAKVFSMKVTMGPYEVVGSGRSKKLAKQDAAQLLMAQVTGNTVADIMGLPGFTGNTSQTGNTSEEYGPQLPEDEKLNSKGPSRDDNPISMLDHVAKKHRLGEPQYTTLCENGPLALQRFDIKVSLNDMEASGLGRSKKVAKRNAAQAMLDQLSRKDVGIKPPKKRIMFVKASSDSSTNEC